MESQTKRARLFLFFAVTLLAALTAKAAIDQPSSLEQLNSDAILNHLNEAISWYRQALTGVQAVGLPSDALYQANAQSKAVEAVQLAFQSARSEAELIPAASPAEAGQSEGFGSRQRIEQMQSGVDARIHALQSQIDDLDRQLARASKTKAQDLTAQREALQGEIDLNNAMHAALEQMMKFVEVNGEARTQGLAGNIVRLEHSVPELSGSNAVKAAPKAATAQSSATNSTGLIGELLYLYDELRSMQQIDALLRETAAMREAAVTLRTPLQSALRSTIQQGEQMAAQANNNPSGQNGASQPVASRQQFDALAANFKKIAGATLPLSQEIMLLDQSNSNFEQWRDSIDGEFHNTLRSVLLRVTGIALALGIILLLSEIWRRVTFRYIHDVRRRRQFLVLRRIVIGFGMGMVLILGFASEFSSLATFAGFITAGLAVGLQTILLSVAAYFFLVGRWGIRVGDRISVAGVTGDVVDVGLVRLHLMELAGTGIDLYPTGRIVVFSNAVLFQPTTPLFKQLPGTEYAWHEVAVALSPGGNLQLAEEKIMGAVHEVYTKYRQEFERQHGDAERRIDIHLAAPEPHAQLRYGESGLEYVVRYPVGLQRESDVDDEIARKISQRIAEDDLKTIIAGSPKIRAAVKG